MTVHPSPQSEDNGSALRLLRRAEELTAPALHEWAQRLPGELRLTAGYHLGWLDRDGKPLPVVAGGKAVRPALVLGSCLALGGRPELTLPGAVAVELVHNFSLVHDDVIDADELRRHRPTVWAAFGIPAALLAGDAMLALAVRVLADAPGRELSSTIRVLMEAAVELIHGEGLDVTFERRTRVALEEYVAMVAGKTGALMAASCALGALAAGAEPARVEHLAGFGRHAGLAFQIADDLLGLYGDPTATGKPVGGDIAARKKTYPVLAALASNTVAAERLAALFARPEPLSGTLVGLATDLVEEAGGRRAAEDAAAGALRNARAELAAADPVPEAAQELASLAGFMAHRAA